MTTHAPSLAFSSPIDTADLARSRDDRLSAVAWVIHFAVFLGMMFCVAAPTVLGVTPQTLVVRQVGYACFALLMLAISLVCQPRLGRIGNLYLGCAVGVAAAAALTAVTQPGMRTVDYLGSPSFLLGVYVSTFVLPRVYRQSAESILLWSVLVIAGAVCLGFYLRHTVDIERNNTIAAYTALTALILAMRAQRRNSLLIIRVLCGLGAVAFVAVLAISLGRTSIVALLGTGLLLTWLGSKSSRKIAVGLVIVLVVGIALGTDVGGKVLATLLTKGEDLSRQRSTLQTMSGRTEIWSTGLNAVGLSWFGRGPTWIYARLGIGTHSSYLSCYFSYGLFAVSFWLTMCAISLWAALRTARLHRETGTFPIAPALVIFYLVISLAESFFNLLVGGFEMLFYLGTGMCLLELNNARRRSKQALTQTRFTRAVPSDAHVPNGTYSARGQDPV